MKFCIWTDIDGFHSVKFCIHIALILSQSDMVKINKTETVFQAY
jgi:hypothetical protein